LTKKSIVDFNQNSAKKSIFDYQRLLSKEFFHKNSDFEHNFEARMFELYQNLVFFDEKIDY